MKTEKGVSIPEDFAHALKNNPALLAVLERMRPSCQREYVAWINAAKEPTARSPRIASVLVKIADWGARHKLLP